MIDTDFANSLNAALLKPGATMEASQYLTGSIIHRVIASFPVLDPYVQAVLLQSVLNLPAPQFDAIHNEYFDLIRLARDSEDEWVRQKANEFQNYPSLTIDHEGPKFEFRGGFDDQPMIVPPDRQTSLDEVHFTLNEDVKPPSSELPAPRILPKLPPPAPRPVAPVVPVARVTPVIQSRPPPLVTPEKDNKKSTKKKALSFEELQAEVALDYRPDTTRRK
jgi:hypothetical protein